MSLQRGRDTGASISTVHQEHLHINQSISSAEKYGEITENDDHEIRAGERDQVIVHGCVEVTAADDHNTDGDVADDAGHEDDQVEDSDHDEGVRVLHLLGPQYNQQIFLERWN